MLTNDEIREQESAARFCKNDPYSAWDSFGVARWAYNKGCEDCAKACDVRFAELIAQHEEERAEGTRDAANRCRALKGGE